MDADRPASRARRMAGLALPGRSTFLASRAILFTVRLLQVVCEADRESLVCHTQELALLADLTVGLLPMVVWLAVSRLALLRQIVGLCTEPGCKDWCIGFRAALVALGVVVVVAVARDDRDIAKIMVGCKILNLQARIRLQQPIYIFRSPWLIFMGAFIGC